MRSGIFPARADPRSGVVLWCWPPADKDAGTGGKWFDNYSWDVSFRELLSTNSETASKLDFCSASGIETAQPLISERWDRLRGRVAAKYGPTRRYTFPIVDNGEWRGAGAVRSGDDASGIVLLADYGVLYAYPRSWYWNQVQLARREQMDRARAAQPLKALPSISDPEFAGEEVRGPNKVDIVIPGRVIGSRGLGAVEIDFDSLGESFGANEDERESDIAPDWINS
jgi:hypothetical protein